MSVLSTPLGRIGMVAAGAVVGSVAGKFLLVDEAEAPPPQPPSPQSQPQPPPPPPPPHGTHAALPSVLKQTPDWARSPPMVQLSDSFDQQPLDEDDECGICSPGGNPMARSGQGVVTLACSHRFHRDCVAVLRRRGVASPCPQCQAEADKPPPAWEDAMRQYTRVGARRGVGRGFGG